ncbi:MAG TPA: alpha/beta hydrolase [Burkholderiales bacterium]|nr:alpha/beta hydrolase [Burkholderiales bacterium]
MPQIAAAGHSLEYAWIEGAGAALPTLVFLHEGLGSIRQWRDFPARVAQATGCRALVYDRYGYGNSDVLREPRVGVEFMHDGALNELPELLENLNIAKPILIGHSDGASIALIYAGTYEVRGVAVMAPHVFIEDVCVDSIGKAAAQFETSGLRQGLAKYHRDARKTFHLWADAWLDPAFRNWNIEEYLPRIKCPLLAIQGEADEYGTMAQLDAIARQAGGRCELLKLPDCGHSPHKDQPERTLQAVVNFVRGCI